MVVEVVVVVVGVVVVGVVVVVVGCVEKTGSAIRCVLGRGRGLLVGRGLAVVVVVVVEGGFGGGKGGNSISSPGTKLVRLNSCRD